MKTKNKFKYPPKIWSHIWELSISHFLDKKATLYHLRLLNMKLIHSLLEQHTLLLTCTLFNMHLYFSSLPKKKKMNLFCFSCNWKRKWKYISAVDLIVYRVVSRRKKILNKLTQICEVYLRNVSINLNLNNISSLSIINNNVNDYPWCSWLSPDWIVRWWIRYKLKGQNSVLEKRY